MLSFCLLVHITIRVDSGLRTATVGVPAHFMVTVRDPYDNVMRTAFRPFTLTALLDRTPSVPTTIWDYKNGSFNIEYVANISGLNLISVYVNGMQISGSPFSVPFIDGAPSQAYSYAVGPGLIRGIAGEASYFQVYAFDIANNRKTDNLDLYGYRVEGSNNFTGYLKPCPIPADPANPICNPYDTYLGHYFGVFTPLYTGPMIIQVFLVDNSTTAAAEYAVVTNDWAELRNSPFEVTVTPSTPHAEGSIVTGILYDNTAGVQGLVLLQLKDIYGNNLEVGGAIMELVLYGVAGDFNHIVLTTIMFCTVPLTMLFALFFSKQL
jgi:Filamin/ABP280 repeat